MRLTQAGICFFATLFLTICGCKKDGQVGNVMYDSPYAVYGSKGPEKVRVFTHSGEILAPGLLSYYTVKDIDQLKDYVNMMVAGHQGIDTIRISANQEATTFETYSRSIYKVNKGKNRLELSTKDTLTGYSYFDQYSKTLPYLMSELKPLVFNEYLYSSVPEYTFGYKAIEKLVVIPKNDELEIPLLTFAWYKKQGASSGNYFYNKYNLLDPQFYKTMLSGDTVVLKETTILYRR